MGSLAGDRWILPPLPGLGHNVFMVVDIRVRSRIRR